MSYMWARRKGADLLVIINKLNYKLQAQNQGTIGRRYRE